MLAAAKAEAAANALDSMNQAVIIVDYRGRPLGLNEKAGRSIGNGLTILRGEIKATHPSSDRELQDLLARVVRKGRLHETPPLEPIAVLRSEQQPLIVRAAPLVGAGSDSFSQATALLILIDPAERSVPDDKLLCGLFGLTPAEARIAAGLARGKELRAVAEEHRIALATARIQLKSVFAKTETHRQSELVMLLSLLAVFNRVTSQS